MSDGYTVEERLEGCRIALMNKSKYYWLGTLIMYGGLVFIYLGIVVVGLATGGIGKGVLFVVVIGFLTAIAGGTYSGWPVIKACMSGGLGSAIGGAFKADYEVVTVDSSGRKISSDGGNESMMTNFMMKIGIILFVWTISTALVLINIIILTVKAYALKAKAKGVVTPKPTIGFITLRNAIVAGLPVIVGIIVLVFGLAFFTVANTVEKAEIDAALKNFPGQTLMVNSDTLNLYSEASSTSSVVKSLNKRDKVTSTGNVSGLWVPVESGSDKGFVFVPYVRLRGTDIFERFYPFEATTSARIQLDPVYSDGRSLELPIGSKVIIMRAGSNASEVFRVEYKNYDYKVTYENAVNLVPKLNADGTSITHSKDRPKEFEREAPFEAITTEDILTSNNKSIPKGAKVTVTGGFTSSGISQAFVDYDGSSKNYVYWRYLKIAE